MQRAARTGASRETIMRPKLFGLLATAALLGFAGQAALADTTLTFRFNDPEAPEMRKALDVFEQENPGIKVEMQRVSWGDAQQQFLREAAVGTSPDVAQLAFVWPRSFGAAEAILPLDDLIAKGKIGLEGWDDFMARDLAYGADGKIYGIPWTTDTFAMLYNTDLLKQAGYDQFPTSWGDLRALSKAIHDKTGKAGWGFAAGSCGTPAIWFYLNYYWWSKGLGLIDKKDDGTFYMNITPEQIADGFDYYNQYLKDGDDPKNMLAVCLWGAPEVVEGMVNGDIGIASVPDTVARQIVKEWQGRHPGEQPPFSSAPHPADVNGSRTHLGGRMLGIGASTEHVEEAWKLIEFLTQPDPTFTRFYTNYTPAQLAALAKSTMPPELKGFPEQLKTARSWGPYGIGPVAIPFMWNATGRAAGSVFIGEKTSAQAAQELYDAIAKELKKNSN
jgi:multiple sugar transport system substrate-binding protein